MEKKESLEELPLHGQSKHDQSVCTNTFVFSNWTCLSGSTNYAFLNGSGGLVIGAGEGIEVDASIILPRSGYLRSLYVDVVSTNTTGSSVFTIRTGSSGLMGNTPITVTFTGSQSGSQSDTSHVVFVPSGTLVSLQCVVNGAGTGMLTGSIGQFTHWS